MITFNKIAKNGSCTILVLLITLFAGTALPQTRVTAEEAKNMYDINPELIVIDVREPMEFCGDGGHIPCSLNYPWTSGVLQQRFNELPSDHDILVVCLGGGLSLIAAEFLASQGFTSVYHMDGGLLQWQWETATCDETCLNKFVGGYFATRDLWTRAVIDSEEKGPIDAVWKMGGDATTSADDRVIWGHFYADPSDVTWGSENNPDLFVKIWFDHSGRLDVNFFHVSVPDIETYSDYPFNFSGDQQGTSTMSTRYIRQYNEGGQSSSESQDEDGNPPESGSPSGNPTGFTTINDLRIGGLINTMEKGPIEAVWRAGGQDTTDRGDQVVWGFFYAGPDDVSWGSMDNPDLFVKIWFDVSGRIDVNYFHVSVPDIEVYSDYPSDGTYDQSGTTVMTNRYIRHEFQRVDGDGDSGLDEALMAYYPLDGNANDESGFGNDATVYEATLASDRAGNPNSAYEFDGTDDYIQIPNNMSAPPSHLASLGEGSISVRFKVDTIPLDNGIMPIFYYGSRDPCLNMMDASNQGMIIEIGHSPVHRGSKRLYFTIFANGCSFPSFCFDSNDPITEGEWYHFVAVVGEDTNTGYLNGEEMVNRRYNFGTSSYSQFFEDAVAPETLWLGRGYWDAEPMYFDGAIDDLRIYNKPLSAQEVQEIYGN